MIRIFRIKASFLVCAVLTLAFAVPVRGVGGLDDGRIQRDFAEGVAMISVENSDGPTEMHTWDRRGVRVVATANHIDSSTLASQVLFEQTASGSLRISLKPQASKVQIALTLYVPTSIHLSLRSGGGDISLKGAVAGISALTESGSINLNLPPDANSDLSLRTIEGSIDSKMSATPFGKTDAHSMDARIGRGGSTVIARSVRGNITVFYDSVSRGLPPEKGTKTVETNSLVATTQGSTGPSDVRSQTSAAGDDVNVGADAIKLEARLINLNVKVTDAAGKTLPALSKHDFIIYEDSVPQDVFHFEQVNAPLDIVLLLDLSGSTSHYMKVIKKAAQKFVDSLRPDDSIAVAAFTRRFFVISNFTTNHKQLKDRIDDIKNRHSGTAYYDAMWATMNLLDEARGTRKAVVVMTDGVDNSLDHPDDEDYTPKHGFEALLARVEEADATIYPIYFDTEYETIGKHSRSGHDAYATARKQLETLADQTGAAMFKAERAEDLEGVYKQVASELHSLYSIAYTPKTLRKDGRWQKVTVAVNLPGAKVRTKRGYFAK